MERALLVTVKLASEKDKWKVEDVAQELSELAHSSSVQVIDNIICLREKATPNFFIGKGKTEEIAQACSEEEIDTVIFSHDLSGTQQRNLEEVIGKKTVDRTQLILDIFARHARSPEGKMQVELAQLQYLMPRLVGKGIMLSRLGGGIGTRGPGEQKLEVDRRRIRRRIDKLKQDLRHLSLHRLTLRKKRRENAIPSVALVGYTNAGKSTLLNTLTHAGQVIADSLFTTLDPLSKLFQLPNGENIIISDTVGFLHNLPHHLIEAFKATLEEVMEADLLLHILDVSNRCVYEQKDAVIAVLKQLGAETKPTLTVLNKIDLLEDKTWLARLKADFDSEAAISAKFSENIDGLLKSIQEQFKDRMVSLELLIPHSRMNILDLIYQQGRVNSIKYLQKGAEVKVNLPNILASKLLHDKEIKLVS